jgi:dTDP-4-dehydrorhamnose reductase
LICITGSSGFLGLKLFKKIHNKNVIGIYNKNKPNINNIIKCDLTKKSEVKKILNLLKPNILIHLAALPNPRFNESHKFDAKLLNVGITESLVDNLDKDTHIIFTSSDVVFDGSHPFPDEDTPTSPKTYHGELKIQCENLIKEKFDKHHIIRLSTIHSNYDDNISVINKPINSYINTALHKIKSRQNVEAFTNVKRCFTRIDELTSFLETLVIDSNYGTYHAGSKMTSYYERLLILCEENKLNYRKYLIPIEGNAKPFVQNLNTSKLEKTFKFKFS